MVNGNKNGRNIELIKSNFEKLISILMNIPYIMITIQIDSHDLNVTQLSLFFNEFCKIFDQIEQRKPKLFQLYILIERTNKQKIPLFKKSEFYPIIDNVRQKLQQSTFNCTLGCNNEMKILVKGIESITNDRDRILTEHCWKCHHFSKAIPGSRDCNCKRSATRPNYF